MATLHRFYTYGVLSPVDKAVFFFFFFFKPPRHDRPTLSSTPRSFSTPRFAIKLARLSRVITVKITVTEVTNRDSGVSSSPPRSRVENKSDCVNARREPCLLYSIGCLSTISSFPSPIRWKLTFSFFPARDSLRSFRHVFDTTLDDT